jgi:uroporphyrinogen decarboxylase
MNMYNWIDQIIYSERKNPCPYIFPGGQHLYITGKGELSRTAPFRQLACASLPILRHAGGAEYMDLSVEAEAFGAFTVFKADEIRRSWKNDCDRGRRGRARNPEVGAGLYRRKSGDDRKAQISSATVPVIAQCIGPFSLAGRLLNVNDIMLQCYENPELVHKVLKKATAFITSYAQALKKVGADGIIMAEPLAGLLSPQLIEEFSTQYVREIVGTLQDKNFIFIYHNCGSAVPFLLDSIYGYRLLCFSFRRLCRHAEHSGKGAAQLSHHGQYQPGEGLQQRNDRTGAP